jgi:hypothetical protein
MVRLMRFSAIPAQEVSMKEGFHADGETWLVRTEESDPRRDVVTIVFHCVSNDQRPYRVVEVPAPLLEGRTAETSSDEELTELFGRTHTMDYSHDPGAEQIPGGGE